jgi:hypothetical protein
LALLVLSALLALSFSPAALCSSEDAPPAGLPSAGRLGLTIPDKMLTVADEVIE